MLSSGHKVEFQIKSTAPIQIYKRHLEIVREQRKKIIVSTIGNDGIMKRSRRNA